MDRLKEIYGDDLIDPDWRKPKSTTTTTTQTDAITKAVMARMAPQTDERHTDLTSRSVSYVPS